MILEIDPRPTDNYLFLFFGLYGGLILTDVLGSGIWGTKLGI